MVSDPLARVKRAAVRKRLSELEYREAFRVARAAGLTFTEIGRAAGVSKQAARKIVGE